MDSSEKKRKLLIGSALVATLLAVAMVENEETEDTISTVEPTQVSRSANERAVKKQENSAETLDVSKLGQRKFNPKAGELFASTNWTPKPPPIDPEEQAAREEQSRKAFVPPPPTAPSVPFKYAGKAISDNQTWVFLSQAKDNHIAKIGGKITDQYRLDAINEESVSLTYLPLNIKQTLTINNKLAGKM
ncbi:MAG TPA: hypothetical protein PLV19_05405 [Nitrosomonas sp.]|nr:hypothetical protein [Nitrosomonas sp.]HQX13589.1 hypothetical protein [Nitrosomonas sp.]HRB32975.1 hypothetical protein [Nitrosomonas sp.]HRB45636.1 hypothetical protein [Nitrosomonas sp.]HRB77641.1 hypothetical protein [Nitrosomonas sp.]